MLERSIFLVDNAIKPKICRKSEMFNKGMVLGAIVTQIVPQMMQLKKFHHHQIEVNLLSYSNLRSVQPMLCHLIDFITVQHQVGCESVMLIKKDVLIFNAGCFTDVQTATARNLFDVASSDILDKFVSSLVNKCRIHNVISFRGWHSEWNRGSQVHDSFLFSLLFSVLKIGFVHFIHDAVHILRGQISAGK